jgi:ankyrin repeat protein
MPLISLVLWPLVVIVPIYLAIEYGIARAVVGAVWALEFPPRIRGAVIIGLMLVLGVAASQPIYFPISHGSQEWVNLPRILGLRRTLGLTPTIPEAIKDNDPAAAKAAIRRAADPLAPDAWSMSPFEYAASEGYADVLAELWPRVEGRIEPEELKSAFHSAFGGQHAAALRFLLEVDRGRTLSLQSIHVSNLELSLEKAAAEGDAEWVALLVSHQVDPGKALDVSFRRGKANVVEALIKSGAYDLTNGTLLADAIRFKQWGAVDLMLELGASPNARDAEGRTPLMVAAATAGGSSEYIVRPLVLAGGDPNARDNHGRTPLMYLFMKVPEGELDAYGGQDTRLVNALLEAGADPKARDAEGRGVLSYATACCSRYAPVATLRQRGAVE